jgi:hypothetical protein
VVSDQIDKHIYAAALAGNRWSQHRPVAFGHRSPPRGRPDAKPILEAIARDARRPLLVARELEDSESVLPLTCPLRRLRRLQAAMLSAADLLAAQSPEAASDLLAEFIQVFRRVDRRGLQELAGLLASPRLARLSALTRPMGPSHAP